MTPFTDFENIGQKSDSVGLDIAEFGNFESRTL